MEDVKLWQPLAGWIEWWFCNPKCTPMAQVIMSLAWGVLLSPWSSGIFFLIAFIIVYELFYYIFTRGDPLYYNVFVRTGVICASIAGFIIGRTAAGDEVLIEGVPSMPKFSSEKNNIQQENLNNKEKGDKNIPVSNA